MPDTRTILITGCSSGIGRDAAEGLRARGWRVFATARKAEDVAALGEAGFEALRLDYSDEASIEAALATVLERTGGRLDALFNNGGYGQTGAVEDVTTDQLRAQMEANFFGWHALTRRVIPLMRAQGHGRIVFCSSVLGYVGALYRGAYVASKHAVEGLADVLRLELAEWNIAVSLIEPGPIASRFRQNALAVFRQTIDVEKSAHREHYRKQLARLEGRRPSRFTLPPSAVTKALIHAVESPRPRARYRVTTLAKGAAVLKRVLPTRVFDRLVGPRS